MSPKATNNLARGEANVCERNPGKFSN